MTWPIVVAYGGGVNSCAVLVGMYERGIRPDRIDFADTGRRNSELPDTYQHIDMMSEWCQKVGFPPINTFRHETDTLYDSCIRNHTLPSLAYGFRGCSVKFKHQIQHKALKAWEPAIESWQAGGKVTKIIGFDAGESHRKAVTEDEYYRYRYPLIEWGWRRRECVEAILRYGLPVPPKSSCFFCPAHKKSEVIWLSVNYPDLFERAVAMERNAAGYNEFVRGLGRHWSWEEIVAADAAQLKMFPEVIQIPCMCFDGEDEEDITA